VYQRVEDGRTAPRREERAHAGQRARGPDTAQLLQLQRTAGNHAVSRLIQRSRVLMRMKLLGADHEEPREVTSLPRGPMWWKCTKDTDVVWLHDDRLAELEQLLPGYTWTQEWSHEEEAEDAGIATASAEPNINATTDSTRTATTQPSALDLGFADSHEDSHLITYSTAIPGQKKTSFKKTIDPTKKDPNPVTEVSELAAERYGGTVTAVHYRVPAGGRTHWEIMCDAEIQLEKEGALEIFLIKFDFTSGGYRMIYGASDDSGLATRASKKVTVPVVAAMQAFREVATGGGEYEEGRNECGTFARAFYTKLAGENPEPDESTKPAAKEGSKTGTKESKSEAEDLVGFL
jgi:hypothetical protein